MTSLPRLFAAAALAVGLFATSTSLLPGQEKKDLCIK